MGAVEVVRNREGKEAGVDLSHMHGDVRQHSQKPGHAADGARNAGAELHPPQADQVCEETWGEIARRLMIEKLDMHLKILELEERLDFARMEYRKLRSAYKELIGG